MSDTPGSAQSDSPPDDFVDTSPEDVPPTAGQLRANGIVIPANIPDSAYVYNFNADTGGD